MTTGRSWGTYLAVLLALLELHARGDLRTDPHRHQSASQARTGHFAAFS